MATFLWTLEWGGLTIALLGMGRERWLTHRRRWSLPGREEHR